MYNRSVMSRFRRLSYAGEATEGQIFVGHSGDRQSGLLVVFTVAYQSEDKPVTIRYRCYGDVACLVACDWLSEQLEARKVWPQQAFSSTAVLRELGIATGKQRSVEVALLGLKQAWEAYITAIHRS